VDIADLKEILRILEAQDITEFELEQDGVKLRVCRASTASGAGSASPPLAYSGTVASHLPAASPTPHATGAPPDPATGPSAVADPAAAGTVVKSPIVGTFYRSPDPNAPAFVSVGDRVKEGQILCIIEAMKLMNEIEAKVAGRIVKILVENAQSVEYGQALFLIEPPR
jgi:acetyl-CoA carboxylase biotin carboxyl carrier protein